MCFVLVCSFPTLSHVLSLIYFSYFSESEEEECMYVIERDDGDD